MGSEMCIRDRQRAARRVCHRGPRITGQDGVRRVADALQSAAEQRITREQAAGRIDPHGVGQAERVADDDLLVCVRGGDLGDVDGAGAIAECGVGGQCRRRRDREISCTEVGAVDPVVPAGDECGIGDELAGAAFTGDDHGLSLIHI